ncbi:Zn(2)-C6 fungal-type domain-containing protein [Mycena chlorophos]|uniref:Zn(2)-C6 fungal-type domain-containing protein n=1 Tax=Mycena chlorophos TaxID=658473 RepID=A0A8H6TPR0_MYCCL|nr:Zn(2)-C6 fungal-type domain-containing protein [Mycena chlorophos]
MAAIWTGVSTLWVSTFLYGIYVTLFARCLSILMGTRAQRTFGRIQVAMMLNTVFMFLLSTVSAIIFLLQGATAYGSLKLNLNALQVAGVVVYVTNSILADSLLIYRCYVIWDTIYITLVPLALLLTTMVLGYLIQLRLFFILSLTTNLFVPALIAGRLWWVIRRLRGNAALAAATRRQSRRAVIILLESGLIYSAVVSVHMVYFHYQDPMDEVVYAALSQIVGIVPTLIIVRVGRGISQGSERTAVGSNASTLTRKASTFSQRSDVDRDSTIIGAPPAYMPGRHASTQMQEKQGNAWEDSSSV